MKRVALAFVGSFALSCAGTKAPNVMIGERVLPLATQAHVAAVTNETQIPPSAALASSGTDGAWARDIPQSKNYRASTLPPSTQVLATWRMGRSHAAKTVPPEDDYPGNHVMPVDLVVRAGEREVVVSFDERSGTPDPLLLSYCAHRGFVSQAEADVQRAPDPNVAAWFMVGIPQGSSDFMIVRDGPTLHVLHRESSDGKCDDAKQGPLDICEGFEWERAADVTVTVTVDAHARLFENIDDGNATSHAFDCGAQRPGGDSLRAP
jgi:hypothetical protein